MAYDPDQRLERMKELMKPIDREIMMCDDKQDLLALASVMVASARNIYVQLLGHEGALIVMQTVMENINNAKR